MNVKHKLKTPLTELFQIASPMFATSEKGQSIFNQEVDTGKTLVYWDEEKQKWVFKEGFLKEGGTSSQFLKADGSVDSNTYITKAEEKTYAQLKTLKDNNQLIPGKQYILTDYVCTTSQTGTKASTHSFDIILTAVSNNQFDEEVKARKKVNVNYFNNCNINAWEIKYCFDNDTDRFGWAKSDGKGVIYYMKDDFNNSAWYDFKNIMFELQYITGSFWYNTNQENIGIYGYVYTFSSATDAIGTHTDPFDTSRTSINYVYNNEIGPNYYKMSSNGYLYGCGCGAVGSGITGNETAVKWVKTEILQLPFNVLFDVNNYNNKLGNDCYGNVIQFGTSNNILGDNCQYNLLATSGKISLPVTLENNTKYFNTRL